MAELPPGTVFRRRFVLLSTAVSTPSVVLIAAYLLAFLDLPPDQLRGFLSGVAVLFLVMMAGVQATHHALTAPVVRWLDLRAAGRATPEDERRAFSRVAGMPRLWFLWGWFWWGLGAAGAAASMALRFPDFELFQGVVIATAALTGGFLMMLVHYVVVKRHLAPWRATLADRLPDPAVRARLTPRVSLFAKLFVVVAGVTLTFTVLGVLVARVKLARALEASAVEAQRSLLGQAEADPDAPAGQSLDALAARVQALGLPQRLMVLDATRGQVLAGPTEALTRREVDLILHDVRTGAREGDSLAVDTQNVFSWTLAPGDPPRLLVGAQPGHPLRLALADFQRAAWPLLLIALLCAALYAFLAARDVSVTVGLLQRHAEDVATGDLRPGRHAESEDELGDLERSFARMAASLEATVSQLAATANLLDGRLGRLGQVTAVLDRATTEQSRGIRDAGRSLEGVGGEVGVLERSSRGLHHVATATGEAAGQLADASHEASRAAAAFSSSGDALSRALGDTMLRLGQVTARTDEVAAAAVEAAESAADMVSGLEEVASSASHTAGLSDSVVALALAGRGTVDELDLGMEAIRGAAAEVQRVVESLGERAQRIGAIVGVIDAVAAKTRLLALNAAIIAAQSGEHGRAFGVVAQQTRGLAAEVLASTGEVAAYVSALQQESARASAATATEMEHVCAGVESSGRARRALRDIEDAATRSRTHVTGILESVRGISLSSGRVGHRMARVQEDLDCIRVATEEHAHRNNEVLSQVAALREEADRLARTAADQGRAVADVRQLADEVSHATGALEASLRRQSQSATGALAALDSVRRTTVETEAAMRDITEENEELRRRADALRAEVRRFTLADHARS
jgi:methyl-accepting chemotaxis protein